MYSHNKHILIKGGAGVMEAAISKGIITTNSARNSAIKNQKTDWEELAEECNAFAKRTNLTSNEVDKIVTDVRKRLNACGC